MKKWIAAALLALGIVSSADAQTPPPRFPYTQDATTGAVTFIFPVTIPGGLGQSFAFPAAFSGVPINLFKIETGAAFPDASQIPAGVAQGLVSTMRVPTTYTQQPWPSSAIVGLNTSNTNTAGASNVGGFFFASTEAAQAAPSVPFALNTVTTNCGKVLCAGGDGFNGGGWHGLEIDMNIAKVGAATPVGIAYGLTIAGSAEVVPAQGAYAARVAVLGLGVPWTNAFVTDDGASGAALSVGKLNASGDGSSQAIPFQMRTGGVTKFMSLIFETDGFLDVLGNPDAGGLRALNVNVRNALSFNNVVTMTNVAGACTNIAGDLGAIGFSICNTAPQNVAKNALHIWQSTNGLIDFAQLAAAGAITTTALKLSVNNNAGINLATVSLGAADSGGAGFRAMRVPN